MNIKQKNPYTWGVDSESAPGWAYDVIHRQDGSWYCTCKSYKYRQKECKHISAVKDQYIPSAKEIILKHMANKEGFTYWVNSINGTLRELCDTSNMYVVAIKPIFATELPYKETSFNWDIDKRRYIGGWYNEETGMYEIEEVIVIDNIDQAVALAHKYNQEYIYSYKLKGCIAVATADTLGSLKRQLQHEEAGKNYCQTLYPSLLTDKAKEACNELFKVHCKEIKKLNRRITLLEGAIA